MPVAHPELNPIEMVWSYLKRKVGKLNFDFSLKEVEAHTREALEEFTASMFNSYVDHTIKEEEKY